MRIAFRSVVLAAIFLCATGAFAASRAVVNIPFNFVSQGHAFPAGHYMATLDLHQNVLTLTSMTDVKASARWIASPADWNPSNEKLTLKFDDLGNARTLRTVQLGSRITPRLDAPSRRRDAASIEAEIGGQ